MKRIKALYQSPLALLAMGALLLIASQVRFGVGALAWVAPVPWLQYLRITQGWKSRLAFVGVAWLAWVLAIMKIVTAPVPAVMSLAFGTGIGLMLIAPYLGASWIRRRLGENAATLGFASFMVVGEWIMHVLLPLGVWGSAANTQLDNLALLQVASIAGVHGVSFLVYAVASVLERASCRERQSFASAALVVTLLVVGAVAFGQVRLVSASGSARQTQLVAAVGTDSMVGTSPTLPTPEELARVEAGLFARTTQAAQAGAELVVWTEAATMSEPAHEPAFQRRLGNLAATLGVNLVAGYVVPLQESPLLYENKYVFFRDDGTMDHTYLKHRPVPGEPAVRGEGEMPRVELEGGAAVGGAICYDYDFPRVALANAERRLDLVALPSSDWRGIDPIHTEMARLRAIEGGHSILRSTRFGLSAGIDPWGRIRGWNSHWDNDRRVLLVELPRRGVSTIYARLGDWFPVSALVASFALFGFALLRPRSREVVL
ncbi:MAG: hypothetical protein GY811_22870 [Myxococcales bacterium]|nr:hypothetical protein [Myxococcales bacterium]